MRRYRKWVMTLGFAAAVPNVGLAGPFDMFRPKPAATDGAYNQQVAEQVAAKLRSARLKGADIEIEYQDGTLTLKGQVADPATKAMATQLAQTVDGVRTVNNQMTTGLSDGPAGPAGAAGRGPIPQPGGASTQAAAASGNPFARGGVQAAAYEATPGQGSAIQQVGGTQPAGRPRMPGSKPPQMQAAPPAMSNQQAADQVAAALSRAGLSGYDIEVRCDNGTCTLSGTVSSRAHRDAAIQAASSVPSVTKINSQQLRVAAPAGGIVPANYQDGEIPMGPGGMPPGFPPGAVPPGYPAVPPGYPAVPPGYPAGMAAPPAGVVPPPPGWAQPGASAVAPVYDQPTLPEYAWPTYAAYPNYAAVTYPRQYSASAWPYIGPFYPYPQVPLGWRKVTLEWDDGHWYLDFNDRTDRWWWFMNPKNW
jgi:osmotically-inducible protein OsmY